MNVIALMRLPATVPNPPTGYAAIFINSVNLAPMAKYADGSTSTLQGPKGDTGLTGSAATVTIGTVSVVPPGTSPTVINSGTSSAAVLNFGLPVASFVRYSLSVSFTNNNTTQYVTVANEFVTPTNWPTGINVLVNAVDSNSDSGFVYDVTLISVGTGTFTVRIDVRDPDSYPSLTGLTLPTVNLNYLV